ncbi:hypothetical protein B0O99DRAFT_687441 [Bisporella sp. PMI_857]|nr:hypothetical protein B0O99DRAFT_687441 [Bisporella sp. PMI_857]
MSEQVVKKHRSVRMEVLCLGMCRTGTQSLSDGLQTLGYSPIYHMREVKKHGHVDAWLAAFQAKFGGKGTPLGCQEFDDILGDWAGITDIPGALFYEELMDAYPDAKIVLTTRDEDKWLESMRLTIWHAHKKHPSPISTVTHRYVWGSNPEKDGIQRLRDHNDGVRVAAKKRGRDILEYEVKQGWEPLCMFLGKDVPEGNFPRADDWVEYKRDVLAELAKQKEAENLE